jgi:hypothetical protein
VDRVNRKDFGVHAESLGLYPAIGELEDQWSVFSGKKARNVDLY